MNHELEKCIEALRELRSDRHSELNPSVRVCPASTTFPCQRQLFFPIGLIFRSPSVRRRRRTGVSPTAAAKGSFFRPTQNRRRESGKPAFGFPLFRRIAGAVEMWESRLLLARFPRDCGNGGKPAFGVPRFPQSRHFHSSLASPFHASSLRCFFFASSTR